MQEEFSRILSLVDFSKTSFYASEEAALIASKFNSELHLLYVAPNSDHLKKNSNDTAQQINIQRLQDLKTALQGRYEITIKYHEAIGKVNEVVNKYSIDLTINLIVLAAKEKHGSKSSFLKALQKK